MKLDEVINYRPKPKEMDSKARALRLMAWLVAVMLLGTLLSRAASSITMPQVSVEKPMQASISHSVEAYGKLEAISETPVTALAGIMVDSVSADEGQPVEVDDVLFTLNKDSLGKKLRQEKVALQKLRLELSSQLLNDKITAQKEQLDYERAYEDYSNAFDRSYETLEDARRARGQALSDMRTYYTEHKEVIDRWQGNLALGASSLDGEELEIVTKYRQLQAEYEAADSVYEAARDSRSDSWKNAERGMEDAELALGWDADYQAEIMGITVAMQEEELKELQRLADDGGAIRSPIDGVVSRMAVQSGGLAPAEAAAMVASSDGGFRLVAEFIEDDMEYIEYGGAATVSFSTGMPIKVSLSGVRGQTVTAVLPEGKGEPGARGVLQIVHRGDSQNTCVPMSALRSDGNQKYVMVLREAETVLGSQLTAERVDVTLVDNNETRAAVSGALQSSDRVIVSSSKPVRTGDTVRLLSL